MFKTANGITVTLEDTVFVIHRELKTGARGRQTQSRNDKEAAIFKMIVFGIHQVLEPVENDMQRFEAITYIEGAAWPVSVLPKNLEHTWSTPCVQLRGDLGNTFSTLPFAETVLPLFKEHGLAEAKKRVFALMANESEHEPDEAVGAVDKSELATCEYCGRLMEDNGGCDPFPMFVRGKEYSRIKVGEEGDFFKGGDSPCVGCGSVPGQFHHLGCDNERCPLCGSQFIGCACKSDS